MKESRDCKRMPVNLEAELVYDNASCFAFIENISEYGIYAKITCIERIEDFKPDTKVNVKFRLPSGQSLDLLCKEVWSKKNISTSLIEQIGMEIINPSKEYQFFYQAMKSAH